MDLKSIGAVPVLPFQSGVCGLCHYWAPADRIYCDSCVSSCASYSFEVNSSKPMIRPHNSETPKAAVGLQMFLRANANSQAYKFGWQYKSTSSDVSSAEKQDAQLFIRELLEYGLSHEGCLAGQLKLSQPLFEIVSWVPSKKVSHEEHQLGTILKNSSAKARVNPLLSFESETVKTIAGVERRKYNWRVSVNANSAPNSVLLIDDMWTKGETMLSAASSLFSAGVSRIGMLALGRHVNRYGYLYSPDGIYENLARGSDLDVRFCAHCDSRSTLRPADSLGSKYGDSPKKHSVEVMLQKVEAAPDWEISWTKAAKEVVGAEVWCREFKFGTVMEYFPIDNSVKIDFGIFRFRRFSINDPALKWKPIER